MHNCHKAKQINITVFDSLGSVLPTVKKCSLAAIFFVIYYNFVIKINLPSLTNIRFLTQ